MTHEEFIFQKQILGEVLNYEIKDGVLYIKDDYDCYDEVLPDNIVFNNELYIYANLKYLPKGLTVHGNFGNGGVYDSDDNKNITETPKDMIVCGEQSYSGFPNLKYLNHIKDGDTVKSSLTISYTNIEVLPDNLTIDGTLDVCHSKLKTLPNNLKVLGGIEFSKSSTPNAEFVNSACIGGDVWCYDKHGVTNIKGTV